MAEIAAPAEANVTPPPPAPAEANETPPPPAPPATKETPQAERQRRDRR